MRPTDDTTDPDRCDQHPSSQPPEPKLDRYIHYEKGDYLVISDRFEANGWLQSDAAVDVRP